MAENRGVSWREDAPSECQKTAMQPGWGHALGGALAPRVRENGKFVDKPGSVASAHTDGAVIPLGATLP
jgi:hypothetical protein